MPAVAARCGTGGGARSTLHKPSPPTVVFFDSFFFPTLVINPTLEPPRHHVFADTIGFHVTRQKMAAACSCRSTALRVFVRSVAQIYIPNETVARPSWRQARRQPYAHITTGTRAPALAKASYSTRPSHTVADPGTSIPTPAAGPAAADRQKPLGPSNATVQDDPDNVLSTIERLSEHARKKRNRYADPTGHAHVEKSQARVSGNALVPPAHEQTFEVPDEAAFSLGEEAKLAEQRRRKQRLDGERDRERARREREHERERERKQREKERLKNKPLWAIQKEALKKKFPEGWRPRKRFSPDALNGIRALHQQFPDTYTTEALAKKFEVSAEAIRRILRTKWEPTSEEEEDRQRRWYNRGVAIWDRYAALGKTPPKKWQDAGVTTRTWSGPSSWEEAWAAEDEVQDERAEVEIRKQRRFKTQHRLAKNLM